MATNSNPMLSPRRHTMDPIVIFLGTRVDSRDLQPIDLKIPLFGIGGISEDLKSILITV